METQIVFYLISGDSVLSLSVHDLVSFAFRSWDGVLVLHTDCHNNSSAEFTANSQQIHSSGEHWQEDQSCCSLGNLEQRQERREEQPADAGRDQPLPPCQGRSRSEVGKVGMEKSWVEGVFCAACLSFSRPEYGLIVNKLNYFVHRTLFSHGRSW